MWAAIRLTFLTYFYNRFHSWQSYLVYFLYNLKKGLTSILQLSFGPIGWLMISEIFPLKLRGRGISIAVLVNFGTNALVTFAFSPLKVKIL